MATTFVVTSGSPAAVSAAGTPGVPEAGRVLYTETFENGGSATVDPPATMAQYVGADGMTYSSAPYWASTASCNGLILTSTSAPVVPATGDLCSGNAEAWNQLRELSGKLSKHFGGKYTVSSYTTGLNGQTPGDWVQAQTKKTIPINGSAFLTMAVDTGAYSCQAAGPNYWMYLTDAGDTKRAVVTAAVNPCTDPAAVIDASGLGVAKLVRSAGNIPALITTPTVSMTLENHNVDGYGNDATFDNIQLIDVSPRLDKSFTTPIPLGSTSTMKFTITNTFSPDGAGVYNRLDPKVGWKFVDQLPAGITIVGAPTTGSGAEACGNVLTSTGPTNTSITVSGDLAAGQAYCTIVAQVTAAAPGDYTNLASDVVTTGIGKPSDAKVTFYASPAITLKKSAVVNDVNKNGVTDLGDTISYSFVATNTGNVPLVNVAVTDAKVGAVTCTPTTVAVGGKSNCTANAPYPLTQADINAGKVDNTASVVGTNSFDPTKKVTATDTVSTPVAPAPKLTLVKLAGKPEDVNKSGLTDAGDKILFTFTVTNAGNVVMTEIAVADPKVGAVTCPATPLAPGASTTCTAAAPYVITAADQTAGAVNNTANASGKTPTGTVVPTNSSSTSTPVAVPVPALTLVKKADAPVDVNKSGLPDAGDTVLYHFTVTNSGNVPLTGVAVKDDKIGAVTCASTTLAVGASTTCDATKPYTITAADATAGLVVNTATSTGVPPAGGTVTSPPAKAITTVSVPRPALSLVKTADKPVDVNGSGLTDAGDTIQYRFTVTNNGNVPVSNVAVTDAMAGTVTCKATALAVGANTTCVADKPYVIKATDATAGLVVNKATAAGVDPTGAAVVSNMDTVATPVAIPRTSLVLVKSADAPVDVNGSRLTDAGDTIQYRFTVTNTGTVPVKSVVVTDPLVGAVTCAATTLAPGANTTCVAAKVYTLTAADQAAGKVVNTATAAGVDPNGAAVKAPPSTTTTPVAVPLAHLNLSKRALNAQGEASTGPFVLGDKVAYDFVLSNIGNVTVANIVIDDPLLGVVTCVKTTLAAGESTTCTSNATHTVTADDVKAGKVINTATATGKAPDGSSVQSPVATATVTVPTPTTPETGASSARTMAYALIMFGVGMLLWTVAHRPRRLA